MALGLTKGMLHLPVLQNSTSKTSPLLFCTSISEYL
jgi:hypothetical protein